MFPTRRVCANNTNACLAVFRTHRGWHDAARRTNRIGMTPPASLVEMPSLRDAEGEHKTANEDPNRVIAFPLPKRDSTEIRGSQEVPNKIPRVEVPEARVSTQIADASEPPTKTQRVKNHFCSRGTNPGLGAPRSMGRENFIKFGLVGHTTRSKGN